MNAQTACPQCRQPALGPTEPCPACGFVPRAGASSARGRRAGLLWAACDLGLVVAVLACPWLLAPAPATRLNFSSAWREESAAAADVVVNARQEFVVGQTFENSVPAAVELALPGAAPRANVRVRAERGALLENVLQLAAELARSGATQVSVELPAP